MRAFLRRSLTGIAVGLALTLSGLAADAQETRLSMDEARDVAARLISEQRPADALLIAQGILAAHPDDVPAMLLASRALRDLGREAEALEQARAAQALAGTDEDRFYSALVMAQARASGGQKTMAQFWLRRAAQVAPNDGLRGLAMRDFRQVRQSNPWRFGIELRFSPSDNVNGAPKTNTFTYAGLPFVNPSAVPLTGLRYGTSLDAERRVALGAHQRLSFGLGADLDRVRQSAESRALGILSDADMRSDTLRLRMGYEQIAPDRRWLLRSGLELARYWSGGDLISDSARLDLSYARDLGQGVSATLRGGLEQEWRHDLALRDAFTRDLGVTVSRRSAHGILSLDLALADTNSDARSIGRDTARVSLGYQWARPLKGMVPRLSLSYQAVTFDQAPADFWVDPREDREWRIGVDVLLPELDYMGFAPEVGIGLRDRSSNYSLYELRATDLRIGLKSVF